MLEYCFHHKRDDRLARSALAAALEEAGAEPAKESGKVDYAELPFWHLLLDSGEQRLVPAVRHPWLDQRSITLPGGDLCFIPPDLKPAPPEVDLDAAIAELNRGKPVEQSLVYLPLYFLTFVSGHVACRAVVSAVDLRPYLLDSPPVKQQAASAAHIALVAGFAAVLLVEALLVKPLLWRGAAFMLTLGIWYVAGLFLLKREA